MEATTLHQYQRRLAECLRAKQQLSERVFEAFATVPRHPFLSSSYLHQPGTREWTRHEREESSVWYEAIYQDQALVTRVDEHGRTLSSSSQPGIMATMLESLDLQTGMRVLEIGTGTGYNAALLATLTGDPHLVTTIDIDPLATEQAHQALTQVVGEGITVVQRNGTEGYSCNAPYDRILVTAAGAHRPWRIAVAEIGMGGTVAAAEAEKAIQFFHPQIALFVGVAGGLKDVRRGDVVVATKVYAYEGGKAGSHFAPRPDLGHASHALEQRARAEAHGTEWLARLDGESSNPVPGVVIGVIAAGEKVLSSKKSGLARLLKGTYGDALAIEMEGHGFLHAVRLNHAVLGLVVRGISDLVDDKMEADASGGQAIAAQHAAAFAFQVLAKFTLPAPDSGHVKTPPVMLPPQA